MDHEWLCKEFAYSYSYSMCLYMRSVDIIKFELWSKVNEG